MTKKCAATVCLSRSSRKTEAVITCANCTSISHSKCVGLTSNQLKAIRECTGCLWFCPLCRNNTISTDIGSKLNHILDHISKLSRFFGTHIGLTRSLHRSLEKCFPRLQCRTSSPRQSTTHNFQAFEEEINKLHFEISSAFDTIINKDDKNDPSSQKRNRSFSGRSSFLRGKRRRVDVSVDTSDLSSTIVSILADNTNATLVVPPEPLNIHEIDLIENIATNNISSPAATNTCNSAAAAAVASSTTQSNIPPFAAITTLATNTLATTTIKASTTQSIPIITSTIPATAPDKFNTPNARYATTNTTAPPMQMQYCPNQFAANKAVAPTNLTIFKPPHALAASYAATATTTNNDTPIDQLAVPNDDFPVTSATFKPTHAPAYSTSAATTTYSTHHHQSNFILNQQTLNQIPVSKPTIQNVTNLASKTVQLSVAIPEPRLKWYYVTRFLPTETEENLVRYIHEKVNCNSSNILCHKLLRPDRDNHLPLSFVSFKLHVPAEYENIITATNFWPSGVTITPFLEKRPAQRLASQNSPLLSPRHPTAYITQQPYFNQRGSRLTQVDHFKKKTESRPLRTTVFRFQPPHSMRNQV